MGSMIKTRNWICVAAGAMGMLLLVGCGGGGSSGQAPMVTTYAVSATANTGGTISPASAMVNAGGTTSFTVASSSGYGVNGVTGCGGALSGNTYTTGAISGPCTVSASFIAQYAASATAGSGGAISPASATVNSGSTTTFTLTPRSGYAINAVTGCGGQLAGNVFTTAAVTASCSITASFAAAFTWVSGSNLVGAPAVYGSQGVAASTNNPGARYGFATWTDASGNMWLFGGSAPTGLTSDLWKYVVASGQWIWMGGPKVAGTSGSYGTQGVAAASNAPGGRGWAVSWTDGSGNLWLWGGNGVDATGTSGYLNDLWRYSISTGLWTWESGSSSAGAPTVFGTQGVATTTTVPGARFLSMGWTDSAGNLWLFGGRGHSGVVYFGPLNELWKYSPSSGQWTWVGGSSAVVGNGAIGVYGVQGVASATNEPGAREAGATWTDATGNLWLFGGSGYGDSSTSAGWLNDMWEYSPTSGEWTWISGATIWDAPGSFGTQGVPASTNAPSGRTGMTYWIDSGGNLWVFGGIGSISNGRLLSDLWKYSAQSGQWTWVAGSSAYGALGVYGTQGVANVANMPGARTTAASWIDANGNLWMFGGSGEDSAGTYGTVGGSMNDLWMFPTH